MKIKLLTSVAGDTWSQMPGDIVDWPEDAARAYIAEGYAVPVAEPDADASNPAPAKRGKAKA